MHPGVYVGMGTVGALRAGPGRAVLVLGPPRAGKTTTLVVPNVVGAPGPVICTSTKTDVLDATAHWRGGRGRCWLFDPTGTVTAPPGVEPLRWSPVAAAADWDDALVVTRAMSRSARPASAGGVGTEAGHFVERAEALLAPLLHAAALVGAPVSEVVRWVLRHSLVEAEAVLRARGATLAADVLSGIAATDAREQSGIWSTAAGVLGAYRSAAALAAAERPNFDPATLWATSDTVYICAPGDRQELVAPIVVGLLERARAGAYHAAAATTGAPPPLWMVLDEVANVAPLPDLPSLVSEGGGQGVTVVACVQDLSQARHRWGARADGFASLFGTKVVLPGIGDSATLELVSRLGGEIDVPVRSVSRGPWYGRDWGAESQTITTRRQRRLPFDAVSQLPPGTGLVLRGPEAPVLVRLPPYWALGPAPGKQPPSLGVGL